MTTDTINTIIQTHRDAIADLETVQTVITKIQSMLKDKYSELYGVNLKEVDANGNYAYRLKNSRSPQIVKDIIDLITEHYMLDAKPVQYNGRPCVPVYIPEREG